jgi:hypothetical protein
LQTPPGEHHFLNKEDENMERNLQKKLAAAAAALFLLASTCASVESGTASRSDHAEAGYK